jgi:hypothetical protein
LVGIPLSGFSYRIAPLKPSVQLRDARGRFCFLAGMLTRLHLDLPAQDCENECTVGIFGSGTANQLNIARLPQLRRGAGTFDLLIDMFDPCGGVDPPTTLRMRNAVTYVSCTGDCNGDGESRIDELTLGVSIALGQESVGRCPAHDQNGDGAVGIAELVRAVRNALEGCGE